MTIFDDTPIVPCIVAESAISDWQAFLATPAACGAVLWLPEREAANYLADKAEALYAIGGNFRRAMRRRDNTGRDTLAAFMRHWIAAEMLKQYPRLQAEISDYLRGC